MKKIFLLALILVSCATQESKVEFNFQNPNLTVEQRVEDLISRLTLEEKIGLLSFESKAIDRLGVPEYNWWNECLHGVARAGLATVFPQAIGLGATWDTTLIKSVAEVISTEGRAKYHEFVKNEKRGKYQGITFWTPNINIFRDPRWGRGMETYGECPHLTGELGVQFIKGIQGNDDQYYKSIATAKHFAVHNGPETNRHKFDATTNEHDLRNTYLPAFEKAVKEGEVASIMCAYNRLEGVPCCGNSSLLNGILRDEWGFDGYVVTDCGAISWIVCDKCHDYVETDEEAVSLAFGNGTDLNCGKMTKHLASAIEQGLIDESKLDISVKRLLTARFKMGMFDHDEIVPYADIAYDLVDSEEHQQLALKSAQESMVLLKNDGLLPLKKSLRKIAVIGPNANDEEVLLGNYNGIPSSPITPFEGIKAELPNAEVNYALGCEYVEGLPSMNAIPSEHLYTDSTLSVNGLTGNYFNDAKFDTALLYTKIDSVVDFYWWDDAPRGVTDADNFSIRWTGYLVPPKSGRYALGAKGFHAYQLFLNDSLLANHRSIDHSITKFEYVELEAGRSYKIELKYYDTHGGANVSLLWSQPDRKLEEEALTLAKNSDVVVMCMGLTPRIEGESMKVIFPGFHGGDRERLDLPDIQQSLIKKVMALNKPTVLVLLNGSALALNWENENVPAILEAWYPGQAGGQAIADILFGDYNPSGKLPVTFYKSVKDIPDFENYHMDGFTYRYFKGEPLYPFGHGLSYSKFKYTNLKLSDQTLSKNESLEVSFMVENDSEIDGEEIVQLYIRDIDSSDPRPKRISTNQISIKGTKEGDYEIGCE